MLIEDNKLFVVNLLAKLIAVVYQTPTVGSDFALGLSIHNSGRYIMQVPSLLYLVYRRRTDDILGALAKHIERHSKVGNQGKGGKEFEIPQFQH